MKTTILSEYGFHEALLGMGLSHGKTSGITSLWDIRDDASLKERALKLAGLGKGHDKFLRRHPRHHGPAILVEAVRHLQGRHGRAV